METEKQKLKRAWEQDRIPIILRRSAKGERLRARLPFSPSNRQWLRNGRRAEPVWFGGAKKYWELPKAWFNDFVDRSLKHYGKVYIIQPFREKEVCARACQQAKRHECQCSCMGENHGAGNDGSWW
jgi:hypothetical protein